VRLARHGPQAGVLGAATVAVQEWALARAKAPPTLRSVGDELPRAGAE
jgi:hypothetical protein